ncbi:AMP-binding protein [Ectopseudomonas toyotomiensis]|uniref:Acyl-coenzyme A synthetase/AMP-(Fatty) acid ligase n=1 Tax=Ectopseudomonas toyotomiensis TaxID=554344 RepID=A0A1I5PL98_9GAMM|nr:MULTISPECIES: acyl-CoA synthetase family protein [Pseudomonas]PIA73551.1 AMP-binding protein [Pseudomonas toyotomiensis]SDA49747.1 Acyl-coenzyme A synthetase/AMP-(fatty) acid ligase [Pseudomonas sp. NFPP33]SFP34803.1 Acyl-coenzyme A synthetase/AMP-(fatty) acid ligase [Pseudomonas toyotomiensis]
MIWLPLTDLLLEAQPERQVALQPTLHHAALRERALRLAAALQARGVQRVALYLEDAAELAIALLGAWRAGVEVLLPADAQVQTRQRLTSQVDLWLDDIAELDAEPLPGAPLQPEHCRLTLCTSGSSGEPKLIDKSLAQLANEVEALERLWGQNLGQATVLGSVACQHIYGLLFRLLWPLCAGRPLYRRALPFPEDLQQASLSQTDFVWVASPALLKRMGDNLDWSALSCVKQVFSSGGALPSEAAESLHERLGQWPTEIYGSSETGGIGWRQGDTAWLPFPGVELSLDETGALRIASPYLPAGHIEQSADAAEIGADGRFVLRGRLDRIIKLEEKRISLPMLEQALISHDWVTDARLGVIQEGRAFLGAVLALSPNGVHVLRNQGRRSVTETLRRHLAEHCETIALPRRWRLLLELPYSSQGKLAQSQIDALLAAPRPTRVEPVSAEQRDGEWLLQLQVPLDLAHFTGHFPQTPVLPGVVQVDWAQQLARQLIIDLPPRFAGMEVLKFQQLVRPGDTLQLSLRFDAERGKLYFAYRNGEAACSSGRILLEQAHG